MAQSGHPPSMTDSAMPPKRVEISDETVAEAMRLARATQVPGQSKEQTQLIAHGIQKGIAEYKRSQKAKQRAADRAKKQLHRQNSRVTESPIDGADTADEPQIPPGRAMRWLPWGLLALTWCGIGIVWWLRH